MNLEFSAHFRVLPLQRLNHSNQSSPSSDPHDTQPSDFRRFEDIRTSDLHLHTTTSLLDSDRKAYPLTYLHNDCL